MKYLIVLVVIVTLILKVIFGVVGAVERIEKQHRYIVEISITSNQSEGVF